MVILKKLVGLWLFAIGTLVQCSVSSQTNNSLAQKPPMGWNSFDSYGVYLYTDAAYKNLEAMAAKLQPFGYEYFVVDNGWFGEYKLKPGTNLPNEKHASDIRINQYGIVQPSETYFPDGIKKLAEATHAKGLKFGIHLMRGIPRKAYRLNTPIKGTSYTARDVADTTSICNWCDYNYGVDMSKPGAQEFYNSLVKQLADWGVDMIKADDIVPFPKEVEAMAKAIKNSGRPILLSLSPGITVDPNALDIFKMGNMLRVTPDIWDSQEDIDKCFAAWKKWQGKEQPGFWIDMDMIPFGQLQLMSPKPEGIQEDDTRKLKKLQQEGKFDKSFALLAGQGWKRQSNLNNDQMYTFITLRAMAASPLMMGGDLPTLDDFSLNLITNKSMIACNQNGVMGSLLYAGNGIEVWRTPNKSNKAKGWIGIFNRNENKQIVKVQSFAVKLPSASKKGINVWANKPMEIADVKEVNGHGVVFFEY